VTSHEHGPHKGAFYYPPTGERLAELVYTRDGNVMTIRHTEVDDSLRGQGVGRHLVDAAVAYARAEKLTIVPVCPYARSVFERDPSIGDVLDVSWRA
jgi:predicted GNAT family acetyltransferase